MILTNHWNKYQNKWIPINEITDPETLEKLMAIAKGKKSINGYPCENEGDQLRLVRDHENFPWNNSYTMSMQNK